MIKFEEITDELGKVTKIKTSLTGKDLINSRQLNKGSAFTHEERERFNLLGKLPYQVSSIEQQVARYYKTFKERPDNLSKNVFLYKLKQHNETLFYKLVSEHITEMLPIVYTPTIGDAVESFSQEFIMPSGLYFAYPDRDQFDEILRHRINKNIDLIIVTDGEGVLGIGDWGVGGMDICIGKLMVYTLCAGVNPRRVLPIMLDVGTNNEKLLNDPMYLGWRHPRIAGKEYDDYIDKAVSAIRATFPNIYLHWEDFGKENARKNLNRYRDHMCTFNDDMQGTGATALACVLSGLGAIGADLKDQRIVFLGAGTAGVGIADQICRAMCQQGLSEEEARKRFWLVDRPGLLTSDMNDLMAFQQPYVRNKAEINHWSLKNADQIELLDVVKNVKPTILIGCSTVHGAFNKKIVTAMASEVEHPLILPLSNPTSKSEAEPKDLLKWTKGKALIATGSPFDPVNINGEMLAIAQCNNAYIFPGLGLGIIAVKATRVTDGMIWAACEALSKQSPALKDKTAPLLPDLDKIREVSRQIALAVAEQARTENVISVSKDVNLIDKIDAITWHPEYLPYEQGNIK